MASNKLWNTGVDDQGARLFPNSVDPHWKVIQGPGIGKAKDVYVLANQIVPLYFSTQDSMWVWADPSGIGDPSAPYVFQTRFYLEVDLSRHWVEIKGKWGADNFGQLTIDGAALPPGSGSGEISLPSGDVATNYTQPHDFSISQAHAISQSQLQLKVGWHTLEVSVSNEGPAGVQNPAGLNMSALNMVIHSVAQRPTPVLHPLGH